MNDYLVLLLILVLLTICLVNYLIIKFLNKAKNQTISVLEDQIMRLTWTNQNLMDRLMSSDPRTYLTLTNQTSKMNLTNQTVNLGSNYEEIPISYSDYDEATRLARREDGIIPPEAIYDEEYIATMQDLGVRNV